MAKEVDAAILAARVTMKSVLDNCKRDIDDAKRRGRRIRATRYSVLQPTLIKLHLITAGVKPTEKLIFVSTYGDIYVSLHNHDSLKTPVVLELLEYLNGLTDNVKTRDYLAEHLAQREFRFGIGETTVNVEINVKSNSESCRKVVTGTKLEEKKTYAFVCD